MRFNAKCRLGLILLVLSQSMLAQIYNFTNYSIDQGLPQSTVFCTFNDSRGYLWVGTESGAARFNGLTFEVFDRSKGLPGNTVRSIIETPDGKLWFATDNGIGIFDGHKWQVLNQQNGLYGSAILKLAIDHKNRIWATTNDAGVNIVSKTQNGFDVKLLCDSNAYIGNFVLDVLPLNSGVTYLATIGGLYSVHELNQGFKAYNLSDSAQINAQYFSCLDTDKNGNLWFGTLDAGFFSYNIKNKTLHSFLGQTNNLDPKIWDIYCDTDGSIWAGTNDFGLVRANGQQIQNIKSDNGLFGNLVLSISRDDQNNLWIGTMGNGFSLFHGFEFVHYDAKNGLPGNQIYALSTDTENKLWLGSNEKGLGSATFNNDKIYVDVFKASSGFKESEVTSITEAPNGLIYAGTRGNGIAVYNGQSFNYILQKHGLTHNIINCVVSNPNGSVYAGTNLGFNEITQNKIYSINENNGLISPEVQTIITDKVGNIWIGTLNGLAFFQKNTNQYRDFDEEEGLFDKRIHALAADKFNNLWIGTNNGVYYYNWQADTIVAVSQIELGSKTVNGMLWFTDNELIITNNSGFSKVEFTDSLTSIVKAQHYTKLNGFKFSETYLNALCADANKHLWFGTISGLTGYRPELEDTATRVPKVVITDLRLSFNPVNWEKFGYTLPEWQNLPTGLKLKHKQNHITFHFNGLYFKNPEKVMFRYKLEPFETDWSPATKNTTATYPGLTHQTYTFSVIASHDGINWSEPATYEFLTIKPPFYKTWWFILIVIALIIALLILYIKWREQKLVREKQLLEQIVKERTAEVVAQKDEIEKQKEEITDSITYAQRIQRAVLPGIDTLEQNTSDCFVLFKPRDIVSGDFYWIGKIDQQLVVAAADCTGHGVPGAFMSMLGVSFMNKIIKEQKIEAPDLVLAEMRKNVITSLKQGNHEGSSKDGMDMALCIINLETLAMTYSGAYNPAIVVSDGEANELKADRMPVGYHIVMNEYTPISVQLKKGDCVYMFSDGYQDQMGGPTCRKFMRKNLRELLVEIHQKPFCEQRDILNTTIENWRNDPGQPNGHTDQMDDILVLGFKV